MAIYLSIYLSIYLVWLIALRLITLGGVMPPFSAHREKATTPIDSLEGTSDATAPYLEGKVVVVANHL
ncbi:MAG: hypothetical protein H9847_00860 [Candidatus Anaerobiospirillum pullicola]|uniref:Uncharacterized protein n=1 Tax=Candidatus Anaerobiospirillum pullicola TaxID=2838451 RepID=A0A948TEJ0_9GAMM|nr:hypothetical protein [Candidatus Anaerobiospirillum pullicola]